MATTYSLEATGPLNTTPAARASGALVGGRLRRHRATIALAAQAAGDVIILSEIPAGSVFAYGVVTSSVSLGTATLSIGTSADAAAYRPSAAFTAIDTPTLFGKAAAIFDAALLVADQVRATVGTAALPASGTLVIDLYFSNG